ncbi:MAG: hypothetical protein EKK63_01750 [Acinetobacter sp.]|uniref:hypothetical protein n=1 Tax=Acinetobacter sp. TaxID=472 RepID=UPI000F9AB7E3|nr:hypothetical protein [Acinetobacter sp.]RUP42329.1 MAG: hypothetical protein EKK63_01750 [Acinetobacter sp.]
MEILINHYGNDKNETNTAGWSVVQGERSSHGLTFDEMLGLIAMLTIKMEKNDLTKWMKTDEERMEQVRSEIAGYSKEPLCLFAHHLHEIETIGTCRACGKNV